MRESLNDTDRIRKKKKRDVEQVKWRAVLVVVSRDALARWQYRESSRMEQV